MHWELESWEPVQDLSEYTEVQVQRLEQVALRSMRFCENQALAEADALNPKGMREWEQRRKRAESIAWGTRQYLEWIRRSGEQWDLFARTAAARE